MIFKRILLLFGSVILIWLIWVVGRFFIEPYFMPKIFIENKIGEKIQIYGPQYEESLGGSVENFDMGVARYFTYPVGRIDNNQEKKFKFWRRYYDSKEIIEWTINWFYEDYQKSRPDKAISWLELLVDEEGDYCHIKLIMTPEGIEVIPLRKNYCFKKIHLPPKFG